MGLLDNSCVVITGGARGQGRAHAVASAREGADVVLVDVAEQVEGLTYPTATDEDFAETVARVESHGRKALVVHGDVRSQADMDHAVAAAIETFGKVDSLIANAGIWSSGSFWELSEAAWSQMIDINLNGVWRAAKAVAPHMIERESGSIVLTSSVNGFEPAAPYPHYVAAKHGVIGLMKNIALELAGYGVRCNAVCPGAIHTPMAHNQALLDMYAGDRPGTVDDLIPMGYSFHALKGRTFMPPQVIADAVVFLNSALAEAVTGVALPVDAGHLILPGFNHEPVEVAQDMILS